jgi:hypothetical protein
MSDRSLNLSDFMTDTDKKAFGLDSNKLNGKGDSSDPYIWGRRHKFDMENPFRCDRCRKYYDSMFEGNKQADGCASQVRIQAMEPLRWRNNIDGPPTSDQLEGGELYIQSFYGSCHDDCFHFLIRNERNMSWFKNGSQVCDKCLTFLHKAKFFKVEFNP